MDYANEIKLLMSSAEPPCISMYLPLSVGNESVQAKITLKDLVREAEVKLLQTMRRPDVEALLSPMENFLLESRQWEKKGNGLAVFIAPNFFKYVLAPIEFARRLMIGETFHIKPMLQLLNNPGDYYVLDLDLGHTRVFYGTEFTLEEIELQGTPLSLEEAMQYDDPENHLQFHTSTPGRGGEGGRRAAQFHGHGGTSDYEKNNILRYFQQLDVGLQNLVSVSNAPVVLGGAEYLTAIYREASKYSGLMPQIMGGSMSEKKPVEIRQTAWQIAEPHYRQVEEKARAKYAELMGTGLASNDPEEVILGCFHGRVATLFVSLNKQIWGDVDLVAGTVTTCEPDADDTGHDLLNMSAMQAIAQGGAVFVLPPEEMPDGSALAAVFRF
jgi:hypothetical protein